MNIVWIASEATPYAKTGGLADVSAALPLAFAENGHQVSVILPYYKQQIGDVQKQFTPCYDLLGVPFGAGEEWSRILCHRVHDRLTFYFIEFDRYFNRPGIYEWMGHGYWDNSERYIFFSRAAMQAILALDLKPDILHANDWHTALCCVYLKSHLYEKIENLKNCKSILTIHNIGYQGTCDKNLIHLTGLDWKYFHYMCLEYYDQLNLLKGGIMTADMVNTVSPTNAEEILSPKYGFTLEHSLRHRAAAGKLRGILNGIDTTEWDPANDPFLPKPFSVSKIRGKAQCKRQLQKEFKFPGLPKTPVIGLVTRLAYQKGIDVFVSALDELLRTEDVQFTVLGSGDHNLEKSLSWFACIYPQKFGVSLGYNNRLAHLIEAGSDMFLMPSRYEPCGLNQMYSMRYGSVPIVRATGGLDDTVENYEIFGEAHATGFKFWDLNRESLLGTLRWAIRVYHDQPQIFRKIQQNAMKKDFSWHHTAKEYEILYEDAHRHI